MKIIGKQIVVELPDKKKHSMDCWITETGSDLEEVCTCEVKEFNLALSEVAEMNQAWEIDVEKMYTIIMEEGGLMIDKIIFLASNPSAWMKRKDSDDKEKV